MDQARRLHLRSDRLGKHVDGRDLWSSRVTLGWKPVENLQVYAVWEHFQENDDRVRSAKQLCKKDPGLTNVDGLRSTTRRCRPIPAAGYPTDLECRIRADLAQPGLPADVALFERCISKRRTGRSFRSWRWANSITAVATASGGHLLNPIDPYASQTQSRNLRVIQSLIKPAYRAKNDTLELNADYAITPALTLTSQTGYNKDFLCSTEDFNRFDTAPGIFFGTGLRSYRADVRNRARTASIAIRSSAVPAAWSAQDLSQEHAWQFSQEVRLASNFNGPFNFSVGAQLHALSDDRRLLSSSSICSPPSTQLTNGESPGDYTHCCAYGGSRHVRHIPYRPNHSIARSLGVCRRRHLAIRLCAIPRFLAAAARHLYRSQSDRSSGRAGAQLFPQRESLQSEFLCRVRRGLLSGHARSETDGGLRWTDDQKTFWNIPSWTFLLGGGYPVEGVVNQEWKEWTGPRSSPTGRPSSISPIRRWSMPPIRAATRAAAPIRRRRKPISSSAQSSVTHPPTFAPEFVNAYELGTKNTLLDGAHDAERRRLLLRLQGLSDFADRGPHLDQSQFQRQGQRRGTGSEL